MAGKHSLYLFVTTLAFTFLIISSSDLKTSRPVPLSHDGRAISPPGDTFQMIEVEGLKEKESMEAVDDDGFILGRMNLEINMDYPGSGANNHHTPNPPVKD